MIESLNFSLFPSEEFFTFAKESLTLADASKNSLTFLASHVTKVSNNLTLFQGALMRDAKNPYTPLLASSDSLLHSSFMGFKTYLEAMQFRKNEDYKYSSKKLEDVIRFYGWRASSKGYKFQISAMTNARKEINDKYLAEVATCKAEEWFAEWDADLTAFDNLYSESIKNAPNGGPTLKETRDALTKSLRNLYSRINLALDEEPSAEIIALVTSINGLIVSSLTTVKAANTRDENNKNDNGENPAGEAL